MQNAYFRLVTRKRQNGQAWYGMHRWLSDFAYHVQVPARVFGLAGLTALGIAVATVSIQAIRAARANPVKSLRTE